ncbi:hypothetical protein ABZ508_13695 [Streptomyces lavendulocolor]|uniref:Uncharacterized protein n=1 Tax=Streptomyces lavendulocolor TaxID=67316 RepID=A0ABV2W4E6_9ACTN
MDEQNARAMIMDEIVVGLAQQDGAAMRRTEPTCFFACAQPGQPTSVH